MNTRKIATQIINRVTEDRLSLSEALLAFITSEIQSIERKFIKECVFGVIRWYHQLCAIRTQLLHSPLKPKDSEINDLILLGIFQILYTHVPDHAAVSETVSACKLFKKNWATALVNQCLRRFIREKETILSLIKKSDEGLFSHPQWLVDKIKTAWPLNAEEIFHENNQKPPLWLRVNRQKITREDYLALLKQNHKEGIISQELDSAILLPCPCPVSKIPGFDMGLVSVQDLAGQFAARLLDLKKNIRVLDACAAPGSKTSHILETEPQLGKLVIIDKDPLRMNKVKENISRLTLAHQNTQLVLCDTAHIQQWWDGVGFDRILLDAPCSATGVIRRHPDIKILKKKEDIQQFTQIQKHLLNSLWKTLNRGGKLLYSTCSILPEENDDLISGFLNQHNDAKALKINLPIGQAQPFGLQFFPKTHGPDGFYYSLLSKK